MWDGSTATTEAVLMAERVTGRTRVLVGTLSASRVSRRAEDVREKLRALQSKRFPTAPMARSTRSRCNPRFAMMLRP